MTDRAPAAPSVTAVPRYPGALALLAVVAADLLPLAGVLVLGWRTSEVVVAYWFESLAVGLWTLPKVATARGGPARGKLATARLIAEFLVGYGAIAATLGWFLYLIFGHDGGWSFLAGYLVPFAAFVVSHGVVYVQQWVRAGERDRVGPGRPLAVAIGRLVLLYGTIVCVGLLLMHGWRAGALAAGAVVLVGLKTAADVGLRLLRLR